MPRGGARPGAGRPPKNRGNPTGATLYDTAEAYLEAVVSGREPADVARIQAAKCLIAYQIQKQREPQKSKTPTELARAQAKAVESAIANEYEKKGPLSVLDTPERSKSHEPRTNPLRKHNQILRSTSKCGPETP